MTQNYKKKIKRKINELVYLIHEVVFHVAINEVFFDLINKESKTRKKTYCL